MRPACFETPCFQTRCEPGYHTHCPMLGRSFGVRRQAMVHTTEGMSWKMCTAAGNRGAARAHGALIVTPPKRQDTPPTRSELMHSGKPSGLCTLVVDQDRDRADHSSIKLHSP